MIERCSRSTRHVYGAAHRSYNVSIAGETFACTCAAFAISKRKNTKGWCAHLAALSSTLCHWEGVPTIPGTCDTCQSPTIEVNNGQA